MHNLEGVSAGFCRIGRRHVFGVCLSLLSALGCAGSESKIAHPEPPSKESQTSRESSPPPPSESVAPLNSSADCVGPGKCPEPPSAVKGSKLESGSFDFKPPKEKPGTLRGGLARGDGQPADAALFAGDKAYFRDDYATAEKHYREARRLAPKDVAPGVGLLRIRLATSKIPTDYAAAPKNPTMLRLLQQAQALLKQDPAYGPAHVEKGRIELILGRASAALSSLRTGVKLAPADPEAHSALGVSLLATGKTPEALEAFRKAAALDPSNADRQTNLGTAYMMRGRVSEAIRAYERAVLLSPTSARARGDLGTAYLSANRPKLAMKHLRRAIKLEPKRATFVSNLGYAEQQQGKIDQAIASYRRAIKLDPKLGSAWINLGTALARKGKLSEAEQAFKKALLLDPSDPRAKANLEELALLRKQKKKP